MAQALRKRRDRLRRRPRRQRLQEPQGRRGHHDRRRDVLRLRRDRVQHRRRTRRRRRRSATATRRSRTRSVRQALSYAIDKQDAGRAGLRRARRRRARPIIPPLYPVLHYDPGATAYTFDPAKAEQLLDAGRLHEGLGRHPHRCRTAASRCRCGCSAAAARQTSQQTVRVRRRLAQGHRHRGEAEDRVRGRPHRDHRRGQVRHVRVGLGRRARPGLPAVDVHLRQPLVQGRRQVYANLSDSFYCNKEYDALYAEQAEQIDPAERAETVKQMQQMLYDDAPYVDHRLLRQPRGLPLGPVHRLPAAARARRLAAVPVRHLELPEHRAGHRTAAKSGGRSAAPSRRQPRTWQLGG